MITSGDSVVIEDTTSWREKFWNDVCASLDFFLHQHSYLDIVYFEYLLLSFSCYIYFLDIFIHLDTNT